MGKIEEGGANVGSMHPVTPVDQVLSKTMTAESVDAEFNALLLTDKNETPVDPEQVPELPADIPPAEDPMNPIPENPNERVATPEEIKSVSDLEAEMESFFGDINVGSELFTESNNTDNTNRVNVDNERLYLEESMKEIDHLCKMSGITSPSTSVKEGEDAFIFEGYDEGSENSTPFFEEGDKTIDEDIRPIVEKLNSKGYKTIASCSGHPSARVKDDRYRDGVRYKKLYSTARIVFDKIYDFPNIPDGWTKKVMEEDQRVGIYVDPPRFKIIDGLPEKQYANWKRRYMRALEKWADELPKEGDTKETDTSDVSLESVMEDVVTDAMVGV